MCAIIGATGRVEKALREAASCMKHRGPDATAFYESERFTLGHHRLSIIDLDARANQPMVNERGDIRIIYNGEIYNFKELRTELEYIRPFHTSSDTEVILRGYEKWGIEVVTKLKGMYAFAILDEGKQKLYLARDHAGIKPLYYYHTKGELVFASEVKALATYLRQKGEKLEVDAMSLNEFLALGYVPSPRTILHSVFRLPAATIGEFDLKKGSLHLSSFKPDTKRVGAAALESLIEEKILAHLVADVPVGLFFSGGTDSSLIASVLHANGIDLSTWSLALPGKQDAEAFEGIAAHLGLKAHVSPFGPTEFDEVFEEIFSRMDEPIADNSIFPTYYVAKLASREVKIVLSGEGGDEYFLGYPRMEALAHMRSRASSGVADWLFINTPTFPGKNLLFLNVFKKIGDAVGYYLLSMSPARDLLSKEAWLQARKTVGGVREPLNYDAHVYLENDLLRKTDMATMWNSMEGRVPLLDPDIIASATHVPLSEHMSKDTLKVFLKKMLSRFVPSEFVYRKKSGFGLDMRDFWDTSKKLRPALRAAEVSLGKMRVAVPLAPGWERYIDRYPNLSFGLISLARSLENLLR